MALPSAGSSTHGGVVQTLRNPIERRYDNLIAQGHIAVSYGLSFLPRVVEYYGDEYMTFLDAGCGQCGVVQYLQNINKRASGVELSVSALKASPACTDLIKSGAVMHGRLTSIPFPQDRFDLVFSSDVLEHIPEGDVPKVVEELVRVSKGDIFLSISLRRASLDPKPPAMATIHVTVKPREWWDQQFMNAGCSVNSASLASVLGGRSSTIEPWLFSYRCGNVSMLTMETKANLVDPLWAHSTKMKILIKPRIFERRFGKPAHVHDVI